MLIDAVGMAQARGRRKTQQNKVQRPAAEALVGIELIDFGNYTYSLNGQSYKLIGGYYVRSNAPNAQWELQMVDGPYYGDLTGDGKTEAVVVLSYGLVQGPHTVEARVYTLQNGTPTVLETFPIADSMNCELDHYIDLDDGKVRVERIYGPATQTALCDHNEITEYRWNGTKFMSVGDTRRVRCRCM
ncbi:MAG TPA: hypothetical protein VLJ61_00555 [Pyrinomonadaceae bacterium]|nr:hypothetical protein [Pyrinomonadaceae bacterium]